MNWHLCVALWVCLPLLAICVAIVLWPKRRDPVIRAKPCADSRVYSVGKPHER